MIFTIGITMVVISSFIRCLNEAKWKKEKLHNYLFGIFQIGVIMVVASILKVIWVNMP